MSRRSTQRKAAQQTPAGTWVLIEEIACPDGNNPRAIREFKARHPEYAAEPKRLRIDITCVRGTNQSVVRFHWCTPLAEPSREAASGLTSRVHRLP